MGNRYKGPKCSYCNNSIFEDEGGEHIGVMFINGYPSPCEMNGNNGYYEEGTEVEVWMYDDSLLNNKERENASED